VQPHGVSALGLKDDLMHFCVPVYAFVGEMSYFCARFVVRERVCDSSAHRSAVGAPTGRSVWNLARQRDDLGAVSTIGRNKRRVGSVE